MRIPTLKTMVLISSLAAAVAVTVATGVGSARGRREGESGRSSPVRSKFDAAVPCMRLPWDTVLSAVVDGFLPDLQLQPAHGTRVAHSPTVGATALATMATHH